MFKILICFSLIFIIFGSEINLNKLNKLNNVNTDILVVENIEEFKKQNSLIELSPLQQTNNYGAIRYQFGGRKLGDALIAYKDNYDGQWPTPRNVTLLINYYPEGEFFFLEITYIEIHVFQSSNITRAYITDGGIGQRQISFVVEAGSTYVFQYAFGIYGLYIETKNYIF